MILPEQTLLYNYTNTTECHLIITKLTSLIRFSIFQPRNNNYSSPTSISPSLLKKKAYKIKTKFKYFLDEFFPDLHNKSKHVTLISLFYITVLSLVLSTLYHNLCFLFYLLLKTYQDSPPL